MVVLFENFHQLVTKHNHSLADLQSLAPWEFEIIVKFVIEDNAKKVR